MTNKFKYKNELKEKASTPAAMFIFKINKSYKKLNKEKSEILKILLDELDTMYGENQIATKSFTGNYIVQNWVKDEPYIRGVYSNYYRKYKYIPELRKPIGDGKNQRNQIYFAGEAFPAVNYNDGYVHTAALSGKAAAYQIMNGETSAIKRRLKKLFGKY